MRTVDGIPYTSVTGKLAAEAIPAHRAAEKRATVLRLVQASMPHGLARFEIAAAMGCPQHWITSSVKALIATSALVDLSEAWPNTDSPLWNVATRLNPDTGKRCGVLVATRIW